MRILWCLLTLAYLVQAQYDSPLPPRPISIPGAIPIGPPPGRARIRPRIQPQISPEQDPVPARVRRPLNARTRPLPIQESLQPRARPQLYQDTPVQRNRPFPVLDSPIPRSRPLPLQETPLAKSRSYPEEDSFVSSTPSAESLSPKPVTEEIEDDIQVIPSSPSTPSLFSPTNSPSQSPPILESKIFRAGSRLDDPLLKQPQRALFKEDGENEYQPPFRPTPVKRLRPLPPPPEPVFESPVQRPARPVQRTRPVAPSPPPQQQLTVRNRDPQPAPRPVSSYKDDRREKKPVAQVIRKYREENEDGSITWGFENDDGTWKEENIGYDCVVRGKYGYVDPDGVRREYTYTSGNPCDKDKQQSEASETVGFMDYENNQYVLPNGQSVDLTQIKNRARKPVQPKY